MIKKGARQSGILAIGGLACLTLGACSEPEPTDTQAVAQDFASRINAERSANAAHDLSATEPAAQIDPAQIDPALADTPSPQTVAPPIAAPIAPAPDPAGGAATSQCSAELAAPFIGRPADDATRTAILEATSSVQEVRFLPAGSPYVAPDATSARLNLIIDNIGFIREARCG